MQNIQMKPIKLNQRQWEMAINNWLNLDDNDQRSFDDFITQHYGLTLENNIFYVVDEVKALIILLSA